MSHIIVCVKMIIDPEMPFSSFKVDGEGMKPIPPAGMPPVVSTFDESALEAALQIKDSQDCKITVLTMGAKLPKALLQKFFALGADDVIGIEDMELENLDAFNTAEALTRAIEKIADYDLVFMGRQAADWDAGLVWAGVAEPLNLPSITLARKADINEDKLTVERCVSDGIEVFESSLPALVTFTGEVGEIRLTSMKALMSAKKKKPVKWAVSDIGFEKSSLMEMKALYIPDMVETDCHFFTEDSNIENGRALARTLVEKGLI